MREANARGETLGLTEDELAFYDALETNGSAVKVSGDETLRTIARELVATVRNNVTIDWTLRENVRAQLRVLVKRILRKYGYPPDKQSEARAPRGFAQDAEHPRSRGRARAGSATAWGTRAPGGICARDRRGRVGTAAPARSPRASIGTLGVVGEEQR